MMKKMLKGFIDVAGLHPTDAHYKFNEKCRTSRLPNWRLSTFQHGKYNIVRVTAKVRQFIEKSL